MAAITTVMKKLQWLLSLATLAIICYYVGNKNATSRHRPRVRVRIIRRKDDSSGSNMKTETPVENIAFIKTSRSGSPTITDILLRYGDTNNLIFVPSKYQDSFGFSRIPKLKPGYHYNIFCLNLIYDKTVLKNLMPQDTKYITIVRDPATRTRSLFWFMNWHRRLGLQNEWPDPFTYFVDNLNTPDVQERLRRTGLKYRVNTALPRLGIKDYYNTVLLERKIAERVRDFDLIMLTEYFDESLVLMKRLLNWRLEDLIYFKVQEDLKQGWGAPFTEEQKEKLREMNRPETIAYKIFNKTFWNKIKQQDSTFSQEVRELKTLVANNYRNCFVQRPEGYEVRESAENKDYCHSFLMESTRQMAMLEEKQKHLYILDKTQL